MSSLILQLFSEQLNDEKVLTHPEDFLGPNTEKLLKFWLKIEKMSEEQLRVVEERYVALYEGNISKSFKAVNLAIRESDEVIGSNYAHGACSVAYGITNSLAAYYATREIIGGVKNPCFLKMFISQEKVQEIIDNLINNMSQEELKIFAIQTVRQLIDQNSEDISHIMLEGYSDELLKFISV